jgi:hypothetical protein
MFLIKIGWNESEIEKQKTYKNDNTSVWPSQKLKHSTDTKTKKG